MDKVRGFEAIPIGGRLKIKIETRSPVTIGAGKSAVDPLAPDIPLLRDSLGKPVIPGSTLKGFFRSYMEKGLASAGVRNYSGLIGNLFGKIVEREGWGSKLLFSDATVVGSYKILSREHIQLDPRTMTVVQGPFEQEYVPSGTVFEGVIDFRNIPPSILSLLSLVASFAEIGVARIGRSKSRGYGRVKITFDNPAFFFVGDLASAEAKVKYVIRLVDKDIEVSVTKKNGKISVIDSIVGRSIEGSIEKEHPILLFAVFNWKEIEGLLGDVVRKLKGE